GEPADLLVGIPLAPEDEAVEAVVLLQAADIVDPLVRGTSQEPVRGAVADHAADVGDPADAARIAAGPRRSLVDRLLARWDLLERKPRNARQPAVGEATGEPHHAWTVSA